ALLRRLSRSALFPSTTLFRSEEETVMPLFTQEKHRKPARTALREPPDPAPAAPAGAAGDADPTPRPARGAVLWHPGRCGPGLPRSEEHTSELQSRFDLVCRLL